MNRTFALLFLAACAVPTPSPAQSVEHHVAGMQLTTLQGGLQYTDPNTKNVLHGYIEESAAGVAPIPASGDVVLFRVCNTNTTLQLARHQLHDGPPCRKSGPFPWVAWKLEGGRLVAKVQSGVTTLSIKELPHTFQAILNQGNPYEVRAFSLPSPSGETTLGVITKPNS